MTEWVLKYADPRGEIHQQIAEAASKRASGALFSAGLPDLLDSTSASDCRCKSRWPQEEDH